MSESPGVHAEPIGWIKSGLTAAGSADSALCSLAVCGSGVLAGGDSTPHAIRTEVVIPNNQVR